MEVRIPLDTVEKIHQFIYDHLDEKYKGIVDPSGMDALKEIVADSPALQDIFKL